MKRIVVLAVLAAGLTAAPAHAAAKLSLQDRAYLDDGAAGVAFEIKAGQSALQRATTAPARAFAQRMLADHGNEQTALQALGQQLGLKLDFTPNKVQSSEIATIAAHKGKAFDNTYVCAELDDHKMDVYQQRLEIREGTNAAVRAFARRFYPMYLAHLSLARKDADGMHLNCN